MNKVKKRKTFRTLDFCLAAGLLAVSCQEGAKPRKLTVDQLDYNDSLVYAAMDSDYNEALLLVDSLEDVRALYDAKICFYRAQIYFKMGQELSAELYYKKALAGNALREERPSIYYYAYDQLSTILTIKGDQQGALATATEGYAKVKDDETDTGQHWKSILLHDIGYCQMQLGRVEEAEKNFTHAYNTLKRLAMQTKKYDKIYSWARVAYNIMDAYTSTGNYDKAEKWVLAADEAITELVESPQCPKKTAEEYLGSLNTHRAIVYVKTGQKAEAEVAYQQFLRSPYSNTNIGLVDNSEYLEIAERWNDLANLTPRLDSLASAWGMPKSMYYLKTYLVPFFNAYQKSGRQEKALGIAQRIADSVDSIDSYERKHNAAELAIIYETQEKENKIKEQAASLSEQRILSVAGGLVLVLTFFVIFLYHKFNAARKLAEKNEELEKKNDALTIANARAEESSRMKTNFIRQISHEIRTPLNILNGFTQVLTSHGADITDSEKSDIRQRITENTERITELINKMLELSEASSHTVIERTDEVTATEIAGDAIQHSGITKATHIRFDMEDRDGAGKLLFKTNIRYATRALALLLDNAQKFTKTGSARLLLSRQDDHLAFIVEDTGIGIPPEESEHIFGEFVQLDEYYDGTGIGLAVARSIVRRLGGDIVLDTTYTGGSRFIMTLPIEK